jgi:20S proteasome alpha/beta subunit
MTLVIAAQGKEFLVLGADSRGTLQYSDGSRVELNTYEKLVSLNDHVAIMMYGDMTAARYLVDKFLSKFSKKAATKSMGVTQITNDFAKLCRDELRQIPANSRPNLPYFGYVIAGLDKRGAQHRVPKCMGLISQDGFVLRSYQKFAIEGKPLIATYLFGKEFANEMSVDELAKLVAKALYETISIDGDVGGKVIVAIIASDGTRVLLPDAPRSLVESRAETGPSDES